MTTMQPKHCHDKTLHIPPLLTRFFPDELTRRDRAQVCAAWLNAAGYEVLDVQCGTHKPRVYIRASICCERLESAVYRYERITHNGNKIEVRYWVAIRFGCEVRWTEERAVH